MTVLDFGDASKAMSLPRKLLAAAFERLATEKTGRVYRTFVWTGDHDADSGQLNFTLATTSKEIHLSLGRFNFEELQYFCSALNGAFVEGDPYILVQSHKDADILLVNRSQTGTDVTFTLSIAH